VWSVYRSPKVLQKAGVILLGALLADEAVHLAGGDVEGRDQALGAVADVFELVAGDIAWPHRQVWRGALQRLHAGHLVDRYRAHVLPRRRNGVMVDRADVGALGFELGIRFRRQPAAHAMRLELGTF
jgi:hypothetical protein